MSKSKECMILNKREATKCDIFDLRGQIEVSKYHEISAVFSFRSQTPLYLRKIGSPLPEEDKIPDQDGLQKIIEGLASEIKKKDRRFEVRKHLSAKFQRGFVGPVIFAVFEKGEWKHMPGLTTNKPLV